MAEILPPPVFESFFETSSPLNNTMELAIKTLKTHGVSPRPSTHRTSYKGPPINMSKESKLPNLDIVVEQDKPHRNASPSVERSPVTTPEATTQVDKKEEQKTNVLNIKKNTKCLNYLELDKPQPSSSTTFFPVQPAIVRKQSSLLPQQQQIENQQVTDEKVKALFNEIKETGYSLFFGIGSKNNKRSFVFVISPSGVRIGIKISENIEKFPFDLNCEILDDVKLNDADEIQKLGLDHFARLSGAIYSDFDQNPSIEGIMSFSESSYFVILKQEPEPIFISYTSSEGEENKKENYPIGVVPIVKFPFVNKLNNKTVNDITDHFLELCVNQIDSSFKNIKLAETVFVDKIDSYWYSFMFSKNISSKEIESKNTLYSKACEVYGQLNKKIRLCQEQLFKDIINSAKQLNDLAKEYGMEKPIVPLKTLSKFEPQS